MTSKAKRKPKASKSPLTIADPATLLAAAEKAPNVFHIAAYFRAIYVMRRKGYSWRELAKWLEEFGIKLSPVHLRRLYVQENARLVTLTADELSAEGVPDDMIKDMLKNEDPTGRMTAVDPQDVALVDARRKLLQAAGVSDEEIAGMDLLAGPVTYGDTTI